MSKKWVGLIVAAVIGAALVLVYGAWKTKKAEEEGTAAV